MNTQFEKEEETAKKAAIEAGKLLIENLNQVKNVSFKEEGLYKEYAQEVSNMDIRAGEKIRFLLKQDFTDHNFLIEDFEPEDKQSDFTWIIDPIDGTTQYLRALPYFAISIALKFKSEVVLGVVFIPALNEMFIAQKGNGAYLNGKRIKVSEETDIEKILVGISAYPSFKVTNNEDKLLKLLRSIDHIRMFGTPVIDLCNVAAGRLDARIKSPTKPWDHSAACCIIEEAGGKVTDWKGDPWTPDSDSILATNGKTHDEILKILSD